MNRPGLMRYVLFANLAILVALLVSTFVPILQMNRQYRLQQALLTEGVMEQSGQLNRVAFAITRFALAPAPAADEAGPGTPVAPAAQMERARSLASHALIALGSDLRSAAELLEDDPLLLRHRLSESREEFAAATGRLEEAYNRLERAASGAERLAAMGMFRREVANFAPAVENRSRVLMQFEATIEAQIRSNQSTVIKNLNRLVFFQLAAAVLLILLVVLILRSQLARVRTLAGLIPICSNCKKVRNDEGYWNQVEEYVSAHSEADFSHSLCPDCLRELYPDFASELMHDDSAHGIDTSRGKTVADSAKK